MSRDVPMTAALFQQGVAHHRAGRLTEAALVYQQVLASDPEHGDALFLLAGFDIHAGRLDAAVVKLLRATDRDPDKASYHANLGEAYRRLHLYPDAVRALRKATTLLPGLAQPVFNLGLLLEEIGATEAALAYFEHAERLKPGLPEAVRRIDELQKAKPVRNRKTSPAQRALSADSLLWLANQIGTTEHAIAACHRALEISPGLPEALNMLGVVLTMDSARVDEGIHHLREALALDPGAPGVLGNLGCALASTGRLDEAIATMRAAGTLGADPVSHSNLIFFLPFHAGSDAQSILDEGREWDRLHGRSVAGEIRPHDRDRSPERRLRIGYVSPDFRNHCQSFFTLPLLSHHDREQFEVFVYSSVRRPDALTARLVPHADRWRAVVWADDAAAAEVIRADRIDILVDLTMHMADARPLLFARKPAPVQVCWLAYPGTTGLAAMDYRLTDANIDPPDGDVSVYSERTIRLPDTFWCYDPLASGPAVGPLPARANGRITFACLNNFMKVSTEVLALWARVLRAVSGSRLVLSAPEGGARERPGRVRGPSPAGGVPGLAFGDRHRPRHVPVQRSHDEPRRMVDGGARGDAGRPHGRRSRGPLPGDEPRAARAHRDDPRRVRPHCGGLVRGPGQARGPSRRPSRADGGLPPHGRCALRAQRRRGVQADVESVVRGGLESLRGVGSVQVARVGVGWGERRRLP